MHSTLTIVDILLLILWFHLNDLKSYRYCIFIVNLCTVIVQCSIFSREIIFIFWLTLFKPFQVNVPFLYSLKYQLTGGFRKYWKGTLVWNGLTSAIWRIIWGDLTLRHWNTVLVSGRVSLTSWGESVSLALVGHPSSDDVTRMSYEVGVLHWPAWHPMFLLGWLKLNLALLLDQLKLASGDECWW